MTTVKLLRYRWRGFWVGMGLVSNGSKAILIDTALDDAAAVTIEPALHELGLDWKDLALVINTHSHGDHADGNRAVRQLSGAEFAIHASGIPAELRLHDGDVIRRGGMELRIVHTPGHSADSICVLEPSSGTLFTGDSVQGRGIREIGLALWQDTAEYRRTLRKLAEMRGRGEFRRMLLGHPFEPSDGELEGGEIDDFLRISLETTDSYENFVKKMRGASPETVRNGLLHTFGVSETPSWPELSYGMAQGLMKQNHL